MALEAEVTVKVSLASSPILTVWFLGQRAAGRGAWKGVEKVRG